MNSTRQPQPRRMKVTLLTAPQNPLGTLFYVWKQSRHNNALPPPQGIETILKVANNLRHYTAEDPADPRGWPDANSQVTHWMEMLGYGQTQLQECARMIRDEIIMILHESIPVVENLHFVFHLENIPISLREQLVRHRIGVAIDPKVGADIVPVADGEAYAAFRALVADLPPGATMEMRTIADLAESTWWSQTSRVINQGAFYDEGRFLLPESLAGKRVVRDGGRYLAPTEEHLSSSTAQTVSAEAAYRDILQTIQDGYNALAGAGVHIEDCRQLIPVGATHGITWGLNLKAMLHIFGKRSSWIAQIGIWGDVMGQMADELVKHVHPMLRMVLMPQCISKGKYTGCPVNGTNVERIQGTDGMPPCPLWVRYQLNDAVQAYRKQRLTATSNGDPGLDPAWSPPLQANEAGLTDTEAAVDVRNWHTDRSVERDMLLRTSEKYSRLWGFNILDGIPADLEEVLS